VHDGFDAFRIDESAHAAYRFFWNDLCDWYLEIVKPVLRKQPDGTFANPSIVPETQATLAYVLEGSLRLMHPMMPFITEELWQRVPRPASRKVSVALGPYPTPELEKGARGAEVEAEMDLLQQVISAVRTVRSEHDIDKKADVPVRVRSQDPQVLAFLREHAEAIRGLVKSAGAPVFEGTGGPRESGTTTSVVAASRGSIEVLVGLKGLVTRDDELGRIDRETKRIDKDLASLDKKLGSPGFVDRAPPEVVEEARKQRAGLVDARARLGEARRLAEEL
jgi:valyl-tRNA synthetase